MKQNTQHNFPLLLRYRLRVGGAFPLEMGSGRRINAFKREGSQIKQIEYYFLDDTQLSTLLATRRQPTCKCNCFRNSPPAPPKLQYFTVYKEAEIKRPIIYGSVIRSSSGVKKLTFPGARSLTIDYPHEI
jgi:hypothetical protein